MDEMITTATEDRKIRIKKLTAPFRYDRLRLGATSTFFGKHEKEGWRCGKRGSTAAVDPPVAKQ
jgi:hypothetical protein